MRCFLFILLTSAWASTAYAQTVYKTVENGVPTFSDAPPAEGESQVLTLDVPPPAQDGLLEERLSAMREATDRMADDRREREKYRAAMREQQVARTLPSTSKPVSGVSSGDYWSSFNSAGFQRPGFYRPGFSRPRPYGQAPFRHGHVATSPTQRAPAVAPPGWSVMRPGNSQLMRPIVRSRP